MHTTTVELHACNYYNKSSLKPRQSVICISANYGIARISLKLHCTHFM